MLKILWCTIDRSYRSARHFDDFRETVSSMSDVEVTTVIHKLPVLPGMFERNNMNMNKVVMDYLNKEHYDFIFCDAIFAYYNEPWDDIDIPKGVLIEDQHNSGPGRQINFINNGDFHIFYRYLCTEYKLNGLTNKWLPHSVNVDVFKDYKEPKEYGVLSVGVINERVYRFRYSVHKSLSDYSFYKRIERPSDTNPNKWPIREDYAKQLNKARITICGGSIYNYAVMKYFEIPACNSVIYSNSFNDLKHLGFVDNKNIIFKNGNSCRQIKEILKDKPFLEKVSNNGKELINSRHTNKIRAKEFIKYIKENIL